MKVKVNVDTADILRRRGLGDSNKARIMLASEVARKCGPYVPKQSGALKNSSQIADNGRKLIYPGPYAHYQYEGVLMVSENTGSTYARKGERKRSTGKPLTYHGAAMRGKQWDKRMMADRKDDLTQWYARLIGGKAK